MTKNNQPKTMTVPGKDCSVKRGAIFALKIFFVLLIFIGFALADTETPRQLSTNKNTADNSISNAQQILAFQASSTPNPSLLTIPSLNITAPFELLGLKTDHTIEVPKNSMGVGWYIFGSKPGDIGPSVIIGHLDSAKGRAIFADLNKIKPGDKIFIKRTDGSTVTYQVDSISKFAQDNFPTTMVYGSLPYAGVRLITCSGIWDKKAGHYSQNLVVFGKKL